MSLTPSVSTAGAPLEVTERITLRERDMDGLGHLNQARYHDLLGVIRRRLLRSWFDEASPDGVFVVVRTELEHRREVRLGDGYVYAHAQIVRVGTKSVTINNQVIRPDGIVAASGVATMVAWDREGRRSRPISDAERAVYTNQTNPHDVGGGHGVGHNGA
jgi:acyl-CoA thioesterase FadM